MNERSRAYSMAKRAEQAAKTKARIGETAIQLYCESPDEFTLKKVAAKAGTSVQTVLRVFGSKAALIALARQAIAPAPVRRSLSEEEVAAAVHELFDRYEQLGDEVQPSDADRARHLAWVEERLAPAAEPAAPAEASNRQTMLFGLLVATDRSTWRLLRRELGLYRRAAETVVRGMIAALTGG
jgi:AcrR family transcriptional regulator